MGKFKKSLFAKFLGLKKCPINIEDWNFIMEVVSGIEEIIESKIEIHYSVGIVWSYSPKKTGTFSRGFGGGGGGTVKRTPFESIFGKYHSIHVYYPKGKTPPGIKQNEIADTKKEAVLLACYRWIQWYNETVLKKTK